MERTIHPQDKGKQSICFENPVYIEGYASIVGSKEGQGPLGKYFDITSKDDKFGQQTWEEAESFMQKKALEMAAQKANIRVEDIRMIFSGDLLAQSMASSFGIGELKRPMYGLFGACSTMGESLSLASMAVAAGYGQHVAAVTSSHFATAEKEFRFPLAYGNQRPLSATWTVTGSGGCIVGSRKSTIKVSGITTGKIMDYGLKDSQNMGACMAPAAFDTIYQNMEDFGRTPKDYDKIITGDLGLVGQQILIDLMNQKEMDISAVHEDCGIWIYDGDSQNTHAGGSGCGCSAAVLMAYILPKISSGEWNRVLFVPTGALMSKVSFYEGNSVPGIAQAVILEHA